jgi:hypothetical protein
LSIVPLGTARCSYGANRPELVTLAADSGGCFEDEFGQTGSVSAATSLVFGAGAAGAGLAARDRRCFRWAGLGSFCWGRFGRWGQRDGRDCQAHGFEGVGPFELVLQELAPEVEGENRLQVFDAGESTDVVDIEVFRQEFHAELAFGLQPSEFGGGAVQVAMGLGAGPVDGLLSAGEDGIYRRIDLGLASRVGHVRFDYGTATDTPGGVDDLGGQGLFEWSFRRQLLLKVFAEETVEAVVCREHEIGGGIDAESDGVA